MDVETGSALGQVARRAKAVILEDQATVESAARARTRNGLDAQFEDQLVHADVESRTEQVVRVEIAGDRKFDDQHRRLTILLAVPRVEGVEGRAHANRVGADARLEKAAIAAIVVGRAEAIPPTLAGDGFACVVRRTIIPGGAVRADVVALHRTAPCVRRELVRVEVRPRAVPEDVDVVRIHAEVKIVERHGLESSETEAATDCVWQLALKKRALAERGDLGLQRREGNRCKEGAGRPEHAGERLGARRPVIRVAGVVDLDVAVRFRPEGALHAQLASEIPQKVPQRPNLSVPGLEGAGPDLSACEFGVRAAAKYVAVGDHVAAQREVSTAGAEHCDERQSQQCLGRKTLSPTSFICLIIQRFHRFSPTLERPDRPASSSFCGEAFDRFERCSKNGRDCRSNIG